MLLSFVEPDVEARFLSFTCTHCSDRRDRAGCYIMLLVQLAAVLRLLADGPATLGGATAGAVWPAVAVLLTLAQLLALEWRPAQYQRMRPLLVVPLNMVRTAIAAQVGADMLGQHASSGGGDRQPAGACVAARPFSTATLALLMHSGVGAFTLSSLLFPAPYKSFLPSSLVLVATLLLLQNPRICAARAASAAGHANAVPDCRAIPAEAGGGVPGSGCVLTDAAVALLDELQLLTPPLPCELVLFWAQLALGLALPSFLLHRQELAQRRHYLAGARGAVSSRPPAPHRQRTLCGERWGATLALVCGGGALVTLAWSGTWNVWLACVYLQATHALYLLLS